MKLALFIQPLIFLHYSSPVQAPVHGVRPHEDLQHHSPRHRPARLPASRHQGLTERNSCTLIYWSPLHFVVVFQTAIAIIKKFCKENPSERLGYQKDGILDIRKHRWYQGFDWDGLENRTLAPPILPKVRKSSRLYAILIRPLTVATSID